MKHFIKRFINDVSNMRIQKRNKRWNGGAEPTFGITKNDFRFIDVLLLWLGMFVDALANLWSWRSICCMAILIQSIATIVKENSRCLNDYTFKSHHLENILHHRWHPRCKAWTRTLWIWKQWTTTTTTTTTTVTNLNASHFVVICKLFIHIVHLHHISFRNTHYTPRENDTHTRCLSFFRFFCRCVVLHCALYNERCGTTIAIEDFRTL